MSNEERLNVRRLAPHLRIEVEPAWLQPPLFDDHFHHVGSQQWVGREHVLHRAGHDAHGFTARILSTHHVTTCAPPRVRTVSHPSMASLRLASTEPSLPRAAAAATSCSPECPAITPWFACPGKIRNPAVNRSGGRVHRASVGSYRISLESPADLQVEREALSQPEAVEEAEGRLGVKVVLVARRLARLRLEEQLRKGATARCAAAQLVSGVRTCQSVAQRTQRTQPLDAETAEMDAVRHVLRGGLWRGRAGGAARRGAVSTLIRGAWGHLALEPDLVRIVGREAEELGVVLELLTVQRVEQAHVAIAPSPHDEIRATEAEGDVQALLHLYGADDVPWLVGGCAGRGVRRARCHPRVGRFMAMARVSARGANAGGARPRAQPQTCAAARQSTAGSGFVAEPCM